MSKKNVKKFYAIHYIDEKRNEIVTSWPEAQEKMKGHNNMFKSFLTEGEAKTWLAGITPNQEKKHNHQVEKSKLEKKEKAQYKKYTVSLPPDVASVLDGLLQKRRTTVSALVEDFIRTDYMSED